MAANLTEQVRGIVKVVTAVANGELTQKLTVNAKGEVAALAETINNMTCLLYTSGRHADVHNYDIGLQLPRLFERIVPVRRFATHIVA